MNLFKITVLIILTAGASALACQDGLVPGQVVQDDPCTYAEDSEIHNTTMILTANGESERLTRTVRAKFQDLHTLTCSDEDGLCAELYMVAGWIYERTQDEPGVWGDWQYSEMMRPPGYTGPMPPIPDESFYEGKTFFCGEQLLEELIYLGETTLDGVSVRHYSGSAQEGEYLAEASSYDVEFWVDSAGLLHQRKMIAVFDDSTQKILTRITNHGDDIVIEPPDVSGQ